MTSEFKNGESNTNFLTDSPVKRSIYVTRHDWGIISASSEVEKCDNGTEGCDICGTDSQYNATLEYKLLSMYYGLINISGTYIKNYNTPQAHKVKERSFLVIDRYDKGNLKEDLIKLGQYFDQENITYGQPSGAYYLIGTSTSPTSYPGKGVVGHTIKLGEPFFGQKGKFYSVVEGRPFIFERIDSKYYTIASYNLTRIRSIVETGKRINL